MTVSNRVPRTPATQRHDEGMATRRGVLGNDHVDRAEKNKTIFDAPFQDMIVDAAWSRVWSSDAITRRERSMLTLSLLAAGGHWDEFTMHLRATAQTGAEPEDVREVLLHVAIYAGVPAANHGFKLAKDYYRSIGVDLGELESV
ncbi:4-carboxymuconolactone decarboxylase [Notoacmeibacter sp. MSK16QG-6]|uniref:4-carboxymuconolactone decarboxylase n=1 Tax=Notoacmeibacter sp. MSK16QG-6 TaxID=2957982 RepID=UPI00209D8AD4|nr:4-carboxymuconolactone decarboxylase [Notoacmeibacter sp. MSK16QG-6]MCP1199604.1 4-carboxymuconolactone decarboxylase [Notoacmeibacter sp. MSK16QG-6]